MINLKTGTILATVGLVVRVIECVEPGLGGVGSTGQHSMESHFVVYYTSMQQSVWGGGRGGGVLVWGWG